MQFPSEVLCGYVLAGGASSRMGQDKALLTLDGRSWVEHAVLKLREVCADVAILSGAQCGVEREGILGGFARLLPEREAFGGPVAGISAALAEARLPWALFLAVDQPYLPVSLLQEWFSAASASGSSASWLQVGTSLQPVPLLIETRLAGVVEALFRGGERRVRRVVELALQEMGGPEHHSYSIAESPQSKAWFRNLNAPGDLYMDEGDVLPSNQTAAGASD